MSREELQRAIEYWETFKQEAAELLKDGEFEDALKLQVEMCETALTALRSELSRLNPEPLTLEQLRERVGEWVWIEHKASDCSLYEPPEWKKIIKCEPTRLDPYIYFQDHGLCAVYYAKGWVPYPYPPKEET